MIGGIEAPEEEEGCCTGVEDGAGGRAVVESVTAMDLLTADTKLVDATAKPC